MFTLSDARDYSFSKVPYLEPEEITDQSFVNNVTYFPSGSRANSNSFKIAQKTAFEVKGRPYTTGKVIQRLFIIDLYT